MADAKHVFSAEELNLLGAIHADPKNDAPRLVYATWLDERGDPLGEFIRLQMRHGGSVIIGQEKRYYISDREKLLIKQHKRTWLRTVPRRLRPFLFARGLPLLQFRVDLKIPGFTDLEQMSPADLDSVLAEVNPRVRFAMLCCETSRLAELLKHRFFARVDILAVVVGPARRAETRSGNISAEAVAAVAECPFLEKFWNVQMECSETGSLIDDEVHQAMKARLPACVRVMTKVGIRLSTTMYYGRR